MAKRMMNQYHLELTEIALASGENEHKKIISLDFENHDDLIEFIEINTVKNIFNDEKQAIEFAIGLKMFGEVLIKQKENPLFQEFLPAFGSFMKKYNKL